MLATHVCLTQGTPHCWLELRLACEVVKEFMQFKYEQISGFMFILVMLVRIWCLRVKYVNWA